MVALTRIRNNQVYNSDIYADAKVVAKSISGGLLSDNFTYTGNMTIGNLTINGNTTTVDTTNLVIADPMFSLNRNQSGAPSYDLGMVMGRGSATNVAFIWEEAAQQFQLQYTTQSTSATTFGQINNSGYANLQVYGLAASNATITTTNITNIVSGNVAISGGTINNTTIGATNPNSGVFTSVTTSNGGQLIGYFTGAIGANTPNTIVATSVTTSSGGQLIGYHTGAIGANSANTGAFTTLTTTSTISSQGTVSAPTIQAGTIGNSGATFTGATVTLTGTSQAASFTTSGGGQLSGYLTGAIGANTPNSGVFTTVTTSGAISASGTISAPTINGATIGNSGASIYGGNIAITGNALIKNGLALNSNATLTTDQTTASLFNTTATTINIGADATTINLAKADATSAVKINGTANSYGSGQGALQIGGGFYADGDSYIRGNLQVAYLDTIGVNSLLANAPLLYLTANGFSTYSYDIGFYSHKYDSAVGYNHTGLIRNHLNNAWYLFSNIRTEPMDTVDLGNANIIYDTLILGNMIAYSGNASTSATTGAAVIYGGMGVGGNIYAYAIQNTPIGNGTASTGAFTTLTTSGTITSQGIITGAGQVIGYFNGAIGANTANTGAFTTVTTTSTINAQGTVSAPTVNAGTIGNSGAVFTGATLSTTSTINAQGTVSAPTVNAGTIGNSGAIFTGASQTLTGNVVAQNLNGSNAATVGYLIANSGTSSTGTTSGALIIQGGAGISGSAYIGGNSNVTGTENVPTVYTSNVYPYANTGDIKLYNQLNSNTTINANQIVANLVVHGNSTAGYQNLFVVNGANGSVGIKTAPNSITPNVSLMISATDSMIIPSGTTAQRPSNATGGMIRFNNQSNQLEFYNPSVSDWSGTGSVFTIISDDQFTGDGSTVAFTMSQAGTTNSTLVFINGVAQLPLTAYSVSGTTLTFTEAPLSTDIIDARVTTTTSIATALSAGTSAFEITDSGGSTGNIHGYVNGTEWRWIANAGVSGSNYLGNGLSTLASNVTCSTNVPTVIDAFSTTAFRGAKYVVSVQDYNNYNFQMAEVIMVIGNANASIQTYGVVSSSGSSFCNFYANVSGTTARLYANSSVSSVAKVQQIYMPK